LVTIVIRITAQHESSKTRLYLEGKLAGACVEELARCWQNSSPRKDTLLVDLTNVSYVDERGKELLMNMHSQGTKLFSRSLMTKCLIREIKRPHIVT
jgi:ABC-type transporter Mla MlaB component